eukprot:gene9031-11063_t
MTLSEKVDKNARLDRHSGTGLRGLPKKNGHNGWGSIKDEINEGEQTFHEENDDKESK